MFNPPQVSAHSLRSMLKIIAREAGVDDDGNKNPVTVTREIRTKIEDFKRYHPINVFPGRIDVFYP